MSPRLFLHHLVGEHRAVFESDAHRVGARGEALQGKAFEGVALGAHEAALQVLKLYLRGLHVGREVQVQRIPGGVRVVGVGADVLN